MLVNLDVGDALELLEEFLNLRIVHTFDLHNITTCTGLSGTCNANALRADPHAC